MSRMEDIANPTPQAPPPDTIVQPLIVIGFDQTGKMRYSSSSNPAEIVFFLEKIKQTIVAVNEVKADPSKIIVPPAGMRVS